MQSQSNEERIEEYLAKLRRYLKGLSSSEVEDIISEIRSHFNEGLAEPNGPAHLSLIMKELGDPAVLAKEIKAYKKVPEKSDKTPGSLRKWFLIIYASLSIGTIPLLAFFSLYFFGFVLVTSSIISLITQPPNVKLILWREFSPNIGYIFLLLVGVADLALTTWLLTKSIKFYRNAMNKIKGILN